MLRPLCLILALALAASTPAALAAPPSSREVVVECASSPVIHDGALYIVADFVSQHAVERRIAVVLIDPLRGGIPSDIIFSGTGRGAGRHLAGSLPALFTTSSTTCTRPALSSSGANLLLDWVEEENAAVIGMSLRAGDRFETPFYLTCDPGESLADCRVRLRADVLGAGVSP